MKFLFTLFTFVLFTISSCTAQFWEKDFVSKIGKDTLQLFEVTIGCFSNEFPENILIYQQNNKFFAELTQPEYFIRKIKVPNFEKELTRKDKKAINHYLHTMLNLPKKCEEIEIMYREEFHSAFIGRNPIFSRQSVGKIKCLHKHEKLIDKIFKKEIAAYKNQEEEYKNSTLDSLYGIWYVPKKTDIKTDSTVIFYKKQEECGDCYRWNWLSQKRVFLSKVNEETLVYRAYSTRCDLSEGSRYFTFYGRGENFDCELCNWLGHFSLTVKKIEKDRLLFGLNGE